MLGNPIVHCNGIRYEFQSKTFIRLHNEFVIVGPSILIFTLGHELSGMSELKIGGLMYLVGICFFKADGMFSECKDFFRRYSKSRQRS